MTKKDFINTVAEHNNMSKQQATKVCESIFQIILDQVSKDKIVLPIGIFRVKRRKARTGRNPRTGEPMSIAAKNVISFTPAKIVKETINC